MNALCVKVNIASEIWNLLGRAKLDGSSPKSLKTIRTSVRHLAKFHRSNDIREKRYRKRIELSVTDKNSRRRVSGYHAATRHVRVVDDRVVRCRVSYVMETVISGTASVNGLDVDHDETEGVSAGEVMDVHTAARHGTAAAVERLSRLSDVDDLRRGVVDATPAHDAAAAGNVSTLGRRQRHHARPPATSPRSAAFSADHVTLPCIHCADSLSFLVT